MNEFLQELGKKAAERWLSLLVLPGLLWSITAGLALRLRWSDALDLTAVTGQVAAWSSRPLGSSVIILLLAGIAAGLVAVAIGAQTRRLWAARGRNWPLRTLTARRRRRWAAADLRVTTMIAAAVGAAQDDRPIVVTGLTDALAAREAIGLEAPERPSWIGDRWQATGLRVRRAYGLDLDPSWARLWTVLPDPLRADIATAQGAYAAATTLAGWAALYAVLGVLWWPAFAIGIAVAMTAHHQARAATATLCQLVETAADLYGHALARQLGLECTGPLTAAVGREVTTLLRKGS